MKKEVKDKCIAYVIFLMILFIGVLLIFLVDAFYRSYL